MRIKQKNNFNDGEITTSTKIIYLFRKQHNEDMQKIEYYPNEVKQKNWI